MFASPTPSDPQIDPKYGRAKQSFAGIISQHTLKCNNNLLVGNGLELLADRVHEKSQQGNFCLVLGGGKYDVSVHNSML